MDMTYVKTYVTSSKGVVQFGTSSLQNWQNGESDFEVRGTISASHYLGIAIGTSGSTNIAPNDETRVFHTPCVYAGGGYSSPGQNPTVTAFGALITSVFTVDDATERSYKIIKIPTSYVSSASFHVHWTKSGNVSEQNKNVRWRVGYVIYNGRNEVADSAPATIDFEQTYLASDTTSRVVYRTPDLYVSGFQPGYYCSMYIQAVSPTGSALANSPALVGLDLLYRATINKGD